MERLEKKLKTALIRASVGTAALIMMPQNIPYTIKESSDSKVGYNVANAPEDAGETIQADNYNFTRATKDIPQDADENHPEINAILGKRSLADSYLPKAKKVETRFWDTYRSNLNSKNVGGAKFYKGAGRSMMKFS